MGTGQAEARRLCPEIVFRPALHDVYVRYHHAIRDAAEEIIPIEAAHSVDEFSCKLMGRQQELPAALEIARALQANILRRVGPPLRCSVGVAPNRLLAKLAGALQKPAGVSWLHPTVMPARVAHLRLKDIPGISKRMEDRLMSAEVWSVAQLYALSPKEARHIWGNVNGERFLRELQGEEVVWPQSKHHSMGHAQVLTGANRSVEGARLVARRLLVKAATRLRREGFLAQSLHVSCKMGAGRRSEAGAIRATADSFALLETFERYWARLRVTDPVAVGVMLGGLVEAKGYVGDLLDPVREDVPRAGLCRAIDALNQKFGQDTVQFGALPPVKVPYTGAKIAFGRIPEAVEFNE